MMSFYIQISKWLNSDALTRLRRWGVKGGIAILDQGWFSGSNFVLNILMARWFSPIQYGAFAIGFSLYLFLSGFHNALILEPISVFGTSKYAGQLEKYLASQLVLHFLLTGVFGLLLVLIGYVLSYLDLIGNLVFQVLIGVGLSFPFLQLIWLVRRIFYIMQRPFGSLQSTFVYSVFVFFFAYILYWSPERNNMFWWFGIMGGASLMGSLSVSFQSRLSLHHLEAMKGWKLYISEQWLFGRWIVLATILYSIGAQIQVFMSASILGLDAAGSFRAMQNFILPMFQILAAFTTLAMPSVALEFGRSDFAAMKSKSFRVAFALIGIAFCYELLLMAGAGRIEQFLYGGKYAGSVFLIPLIGLVPLINAAQTSFSLILRSLQRPAFYVIDKSIVALIGGVSAFVLIMLWGILGAVMSLVIIEAAVLITYGWLYRKWFLSMTTTLAKE